MDAPRNLSTPFVAVAAAAAGLISLVPALPAGLRFALLAAFVVAGPGCAVVGFLPATERTLRLVLIPSIGVATILLASTVGVEARLWNPTGQLVALVVLTVVLAVVSGRMGARPRTDRALPVDQDVVA